MPFSSHASRAERRLRRRTRRLWRVFYSVLTLPLGAITLGRFRKANPDVVWRATAETPPAWPDAIRSPLGSSVDAS